MAYLIDYHSEMINQKTNQLILSADLKNIDYPITDDFYDKFKMFMDEAYKRYTGNEIINVTVLGCCDTDAASAMGYYDDSRISIEMIYGDQKQTLKVSEPNFKKMKWYWESLNYFNFNRSHVPFIIRISDKLGKFQPMEINESFTSDNAAIKLHEIRKGIIRLYEKRIPLTRYLKIARIEFND